jgi:predicted enzyme involved in methoxymalonyl-ACP biosynthesis
MTGARYTFEQCNHLLATGHQFHILHAANRFTQYGLIGAAWVSHNCVEQFVMSCRALGLGIEDAFLANLSRQLAVAQWTVLQGKLIPTEANAACREVYRRNGFTQLGGEPGVWSRSLLTAFEVPRHVAITRTFGQKLSAPLQTAEDK